MRSHLNGTATSATGTLIPLRCKLFSKAASSFGDEFRHCRRGSMGMERSSNLVVGITNRVQLCCCLS